MSIGFGLLIAISIIQFSQNKHLNSRLDTVNNNFKKKILKDTLLAEKIKYQQFKEDSYLKQIDRDTNLILWFVAIMFGVFGLISFASFNTRVEQVEGDLEDKYESHIDELKKLKYDINGLKADLYSDSATIHTDKANTFRIEGNYDLYVFYELLSLSKLSKYYLHYEKINPELADVTYKSIQTTLKSIESKINDLDTKPSIKKSTYENITSTLREVIDGDSSLVLSNIHVKLNLSSE